MASLAEKASDLLGDAYAKYYDRLSGGELADISAARMALERIVEEDEG